mmetsp:Transcript_99/g.201  ORF Transcript_99/g.201 Transcript_99/m.201 type:complete len:165 (+) Transcript_99:75-569(+)
MPSAQRLPLFPCICVALAMTILAMTLLGGALPEEDEAFVAGTAAHPRGSLVQRQGRKFTAADRGTPEYEEYMRNKREEKKAAWDMMTTPNGYRDAGIDLPMPAPAPAPAPSPSMPSMSPAPAPSGGGGGGNPFQFLIDLISPTTTTTTTTQPPNPIEAFFNSLR